MAARYSDNDDNNLETLKGSLKDRVGIKLANFGFGGKRANRSLVTLILKKKLASYTEIYSAIQLMMKYGLNSRPTS